MNLRGMRVLCSFPIATAVISWGHDLWTRQDRISPIFNADGELVNRKYEPKFDFLPDNLSIQFSSIRQKLVNINKAELASSSKSYALVTGASKGIGRSIAVALARRRFNLILVGQDEKSLQSLSQDLKNCYGISVLTISKDLSKDDSANEIFEITNEQKLEVDILFSNAGLCRVGNVVDMEDYSISYLIRLNFEAVVKLSRLYGMDMVKRKRGRIAIISSLTGAVEGVPSAAVYAASKAALNSFAASFGREMEVHGISVTLLVPGAVHNTNFAKVANMESSFIWYIPVGKLTPERVAESAVDAMIVGKREVVIGWLNVIMAKIMNELLPKKWILMICELSFKPSFIPWHSKQHVKIDNQKEL